VNTNILVIDDDALVRRSLEAMLQEADFNVLLACNGKEGLELFRAHRPELVIADVIMPEMEGFETIKIIKREQPETRVLAISGGGRWANRDLIDMAQHLGADGGLEKPFEAEQLLASLRKCMTERRRHRRKPVLWAAELETATQRYDCVVLDVSAQGAKVRVAAPLAPQQAVAVIIERFGRLRGEVVWIGHSLAGIRFTDEIPRLAQPNPDPQERRDQH
jgi:DNA-binding response OmpR family regulator